MIDFSAFDRAAQVTNRQLGHLSERINSQLDAVQQRHQERLAKLRSQYLDEQQQINELLGDAKNGNKN